MDSRPHPRRPFRAVALVGDPSVFPGRQPAKRSPRPGSARLAAPGHPAVLPVEIGMAADGLYMAAATEGRPLSVLLGQAQPPPPLPAWRIAEVGILLASAAAASAAIPGEPASLLGPLTWNNLYLDPGRPGLAWVFPLWAAGTRTDDWLRHRRGRSPLPRSGSAPAGARPALRRLLHRRGRAGAHGGHPRAPRRPPRVVSDGGDPQPRRGRPHDPARIVLAGHPLRRARGCRYRPAGRGGASRARRRGRGRRGARRSPTVESALARALDEARDEPRADRQGAQDPPRGARDGRDEGAPPRSEGGSRRSRSCCSRQLRRGRGEAGRPAPSGRSRRRWRQAPRSRAGPRGSCAEPWPPIPPRPSTRSTRAVGVDPIDPQLRLDLAESCPGRPRARVDEALKGSSSRPLDAQARADPSAALLGAAAAVRMGSIFLATQRYPQAIQMVDPYQAPATTWTIQGSRPCASPAARSTSCNAVLRQGRRGAPRRGGARAGGAPGLGAAAAPQPPRARRSPSPPARPAKRCRWSSARSTSIPRRRRSGCSTRRSSAGARGRPPCRGSGSAEARARPFANGELAEGRRAPRRRGAR